MSLGKALLEKHPFLTERESGDWPAFNCPQNQLYELLKELKEDEGFDFLADLTAIDHFKTQPRFEVVYHLYSTQGHRYIRVVSPCEGNTDPVCVSVVSLWPTANWHEREAYDMFGIRFDGHPDLRRILMWETFPHHPLRKEFPLSGKEVDLPSEELMEVTGVTGKPAPMMGGPFHAPIGGTTSGREPRADDESWNEVREKPDEANPGSKELPGEMRNSN